MPRYRGLEAVTYTEVTYNDKRMLPRELFIFTQQFDAFCSESSAEVLCAPYIEYKEPVPCHIVVVAAWVEGELVGLSWTDRWHAEYSGTAVREDHWRMGIGKALLVRKLATTWPNSRISIDNEASLALVKSVGMVPKAIVYRRP